MDLCHFPVLVVDDEQSVLSALKRELKGIAPILTALNADEAEKILYSQTVAVVISDYKMPKKDGVTFLSGLKDLNYEPVKILLTAYSEIDIVVDAINKANIFYFLRKPWNSAELQMLVKRGLETFARAGELKTCKQ
ncbi:MAG: response regulator, partial [Pseudomonadota bacterium]